MILIGHSLGCLIIKKAIDRALSQSNADVLTHILCLVFFGAPHSGLSPYALAALVTPDPSSEIVEQLGTESTMLRDLDMRFGSLISRTSAAVVTCYEQQKTRSVAKVYSTRTAS